MKGSGPLGRAGQNPFGPVINAGKQKQPGFHSHRPTHGISDSPAGPRRYRMNLVLIIDEVGFRSLNRGEANLFFRLASRRYERGSMILTSSKHVGSWPEAFAGDEVLTTAILDRLLHHVQVVQISGRSYRLKELDALLRVPATEERRAEGGA